MTSAATNVNISVEDMMNAHRIETTLKENGTLTLHDLPFEAGVSVDVIVLETNGSSKTNEAVDDLSPPRREEANEENWADKFERELEKVWALEGERPDIPRDWGQNFDKYKPSLFSSDEEIKAS